MSDDWFKFTSSNFVNMLTIVGIIIAIIFLVNGGFLIFKLVNMITEPIRGGSLSGLTLLILVIFVAVLFSKFRRRSPEEYAAQELRSRRSTERFGRWK